MSGQRDDAAERSAHVTRGGGEHDGPSLIIEVGNTAQLRVVAELQAEVAALRRALGLHHGRMA
jgi:hypothetical protein